MAELISGKTLAAKLKAEAAAEAAELREKGVHARLAVVIVGENPASRTYVAGKAKDCAECGLLSDVIALPEETTEAALLEKIAALNADKTVHGVLVQLPLPGHIDAQLVISAISPEKDVDGFHPVNAGRLATGLDGFVPCTPLGCLRLLEATLGDISGADAIVIGRSNIVGRPMASLLISASATVTVAHSRSRDLPELTRRADIVVAAVGRPEMVRGNWLKPGCTVIDVGINRVAKESGTGTRLVGDVAFHEAADIAAHITPVPGGVGPMTIACLLENTLKAASRT